MLAVFAFEKIGDRRAIPALRWAQKHDAGDVQSVPEPLPEYGTARFGTWKGFIHPLSAGR